MEKNTTTQYDKQLWNFKPATPAAVQAIRLNTMTFIANAQSVQEKVGC